MKEKSVSNKYVYFFYSNEFNSTTNKIENMLGKEFECGIVIVNGKRTKFSHMSTDKSFLSMYPDAEIITEGYIKNIKYFKPKYVNKEGN